METRIASRAFEDGLHLKREEDVVGAATLADVAKVVAVLVAIRGKSAKIVKRNFD